MTYSILSIDGGGIKGVYALKLIELLEKESGVKILDRTDCFAGTSTGALIASAFSTGFKPKDLIVFYRLLGSRAFPNGKNHCHGGAKYDVNKLKSILDKLFSKKRTFADIEKNLVIPACSLCHEKKKKWHPEIFDNFDKKRAEKHLLVDIALRSSAAPIYYPSYQNYVDGGLYALNPSLIALSAAIDPSKGNQKLEDISILSIGTGINPVAIEEDVDWDEVRWMKPYYKLAKHPLFSLMTEVGAEIPEYPLQQILKNRYQRVNGRLPIPIEIDDSSKVGTLIESAKKYPKSHTQEWEEALLFIENHFT